MPPTLHYLYDPLCGWCYAAAPLIKAARELLPVVPHGGGMMLGARRQPVTPQLRDFVLGHDAQVARLSGQPFGDAYRDGLLRDSDAVFDSGPPTAAMLAAEQIAGRGLDMLAALQVAHYIEGRRIADHTVLLAVAEEIGLPREGFNLALATCSGEAVEAHVAETRRFMSRVGAQGFPTLLIEHAEGFTNVAVSAYLGRPEAFRDCLRATLAQAVVKAAEASGPTCGPDACTL
jgi:putative protein-disulfide isomerase